MDLKALAPGMVGRPLGVGTGENYRVYRDWRGPVLCGVLTHHAKLLLEFREGWQPWHVEEDRPLTRGDLQGAKPPAEDHGAPPPTPPLQTSPPEVGSPAAPETPPLPQASTGVPLEEEPSESDDDDDEWDEARLMRLTKADLLSDFLDETQQAAAANLKKDELVQLILNGDGGDGE